MSVACFFFSYCDEIGSIIYESKDNTDLLSLAVTLMSDLKLFNEQAFLLSVPLIALKAFQAIQTTFEDHTAAVIGL